MDFVQTNEKGSSRIPFCWVLAQIIYFSFFFKFRLAPHSSTHHIPHSSLSLSGRQCALQHFAHCGVYIAELGHHFFLDSGQCLAQRSGNVVHQALAPSIIQLLAEEEKIYIKKIMDKKWLSGH